MLFIPDDHINITDQTTTGMAGTVTDTNNQRWLEQHELAGHFSGVDSMLNYTEQHYTEPRQSKDSSHRGTDGNFWFFNDYETALNTYRKHPDKVVEFTENDTRLEGGDAAGLDIQYDVTGDFIDIDRYLSGEPEHYGAMDNGIPRGIRMTIVVGSAWAGSTNNSVINDRSKRLIRLTDWLEAQGVRVQIVIIYSMECQYVEIIIKHYDEPISLADVAVTSHSDFFRRILFRWAEHSSTWRSGYGSSVSFDSYIRDKSRPDQFPTELQDGHLLYCGVQSRGSIDNVFDGLEKQLATVLSDPQAEPQLFKVMV
jgi:hypothetical protein